MSNVYYYLRIRPEYQYPMVSMSNLDCIFNCLQAITDYRSTKCKRNHEFRVDGEYDFDVADLIRVVGDIPHLLNSNIFAQSESSTHAPKYSWIRLCYRIVNMLRWRDYTISTKRRLLTRKSTRYISSFCHFFVFTSAMMFVSVTILK